MRKALFILMLVVAGVLVGVVMSPARKPIWQPKTQIVFLGFANPVAGAPATNAWFGIKDHPEGSISWMVSEISQAQGERWKRWEPLPVQALTYFVRPSHEFGVEAITPVPTTNAPLRVVIELEQWREGLNQPPTGKAGQFIWKLRLRWGRLLHPNNPARWRPRGPLFYITNEFNFASGTNGVSGRETGH